MLIYCSYFSNGAQINSPIDVQISERIEHNLEPWPAAWDPPGSNGFMEASTFNALIGSYCNVVSKFAVGAPYSVSVMNSLNPCSFPLCPDQ